MIETVKLKPLEVRDITFDFGADVNWNDTIDSVVSTCIDCKTGLAAPSMIIGHFFNVGQPAVTDTWVQVLAGGGSAGDIYRLKTVITTRLGLVHEKDILLLIDDWYDGYVEKLSNEIMNWAVDFSAWMPFRGTSLIGLGYYATGEWYADGSITATGGFLPWIGPAIVITRISDGVDVTLDMLSSYSPPPSNPTQTMEVAGNIKGGTAGELYQVSVIFTNNILYFEYDLLLEVR